MRPRDCIEAGGQAWRGRGGPFGAHVRWGTQRRVAAHVRWGTQRRLAAHVPWGTQRRAVAHVGPGHPAGSPAYGLALVAGTGARTRARAGLLSNPGAPLNHPAAVPPSGPSDGLGDYLAR